MKFVLFEKNAIQELISIRNLQSAEFFEGQVFSRLLHGEEVDFNPFPNVSYQRVEDGCYFIGANPTKTFLLVDVENSRIFNYINNDETINVFQKLFRFSVKYWNKQGGFSTAEKILAETNKAVVFPFPYSTRSNFRIVIEREPDSQRMTARGFNHVLLVYKSGVEGAPTYKENPSIKNLRLSLEHIQTAYNRAKEDFNERFNTTKEEGQNNIPLNFIEFDRTLNINGGNTYMPFEHWEKILTSSQKEFIFNTNNNNPMRVQGPAGTGKTLSLILKAIYLLSEAEKENRECRIIFFAHSKATQMSIKNIFDSISRYKWSDKEARLAQSINITTLHEYCIDNLLTNKISESEILERDALDSKNLQYFAVIEAYEKVMSESYLTYKVFLSEPLKRILEGNDDHNKSIVCGLLQHEFSVMIKGKAGGDLGKYKKLEPLSAGLQAITEDDKQFIWDIFTEYQNHFESMQQYDTDDIVLSAISALDNPIWRRRRRTEGFDFIFIDETHLFNQNEMMIFHYLTRDPKTYPIVFSIDMSQAIGDRGENEDDFLKNYTSTMQMYKKEYEIVFRCSPQITNLAMTITASGANLFGNFKNPYNEKATSAFTAQEEALCKKPKYFLVDEKEMIDFALDCANRMKNSMRCSQSEIVIISFSEFLHQELIQQSIKKNIKYVELTRRGDIESKEKARMSQSFLFSMPEYVGGLEFYGVILLGVDKYRVPPASANDISKNYLMYSAFNQLYVSVTRAKFQVSLIGSKEHGTSECLDYSLAQNSLILGEPAMHDE